jgi:metallo-beta-lactamase family protein
MPVAINTEIEFVESLSAHADYEDIMRWLGGFEKPPKTTFLVHGEPDAAAALQKRIVDDLGWHVEVPKYLDTVKL